MYKFNQSHNVLVEIETFLSLKGVKEEDINSVLYLILKYRTAVLTDLNTEQKKQMESFLEQSAREHKNYPLNPS